MPINFAALPVTSFEIVPQEDPQNVFLPEGTLLIANDGTAYRARDYRPGRDERGQGDQIVHFNERQYYSSDKVDASHGVRREFTRKEVMDLGLKVVWYPGDGES